MGTNHCGDSHLTVFTCRKSYQDVLCRRDCAERVVASFSNQIQSEYYGVNRSVSIQGIILEHSSVLPHTEKNHPQNHIRDMQCFIHFFRMIANKMLPILLHTAIFY